MMTPILLNADASTKIGWLSECIYCEVTEELNGVYELELVYPASGAYAQDITINGFIKAKANQKNSNQLFHIYKVTKPINGKFKVFAEHVSYALAGYPISSVNYTGNANGAISMILSSAQSVLGKSTGFSVYATDITTQSTVNLSNASARGAIAGIEGSVLDVFGGELEFDNYYIRIKKSRGADNGVRIAYGKNMTGLDCNFDLSKAYTGIYGFYAKDEINLHKYSTVENESGINTRVLVKDFTPIIKKDDGAEVTQADLNAAVADFLAQNDINAVSVSAKVNFVDLSQSVGDNAALEKVNMGDIVKVYHEEFGINAKAKVVKTVYDSIKEAYDKIEIGSVTSDMGKVISQAASDAKKAKEYAESAVSGITEEFNQAIEEATEAITGASGGYVVLNPSKNPQELLIMNTPSTSTATKVWRWNSAGLGYSSTGYSGTYRTAITTNGAIVADFITTGTLTASIIKAGILSDTSGKFSFNLENGKISASDINLTGGYIGTSSSDFYLNLNTGALVAKNATLKTSGSAFSTQLTGGQVKFYNSSGTELGGCGVGNYGATNVKGAAVYASGENPYLFLGTGSLTSLTPYISLDKSTFSTGSVNFLKPIYVGKDAHFNGTNYFYGTTNMDNVTVSKITSENSSFSPLIHTRTFTDGDSKKISCGCGTVSYSNGFDYKSVAIELASGSTVEARLDVTQSWGTAMGVISLYSGTTRSAGLELGTTAAWFNGNQFTSNSSEKYKNNISEYTQKAIDLVNSSKIYSFNYKDDFGRVETPKTKYGLIIERECPAEVIDDSGDAISLYSMVSILWKAVQELSEKIDLK